MIERLVIIIVLALISWVAYEQFRRYHVGKATASASSDPILYNLKPGVPAIVYFTTPGCVPCRTQQQPALTRLQAELGEAIQIVHVDASLDAEAADRWGVFSAPTTFVIDSTRQVRDVNYGVADTPKLRRQLESARAIRERRQTV
jgi:thiol-disulfide isomerase/thioredoxin